jgi:hypothetical protein
MPHSFVAANEQKKWGQRGTILQLHFYLFEFALTFKFRQLGVNLAYAQFYFAINQFFVVVLMVGKTRGKFFIFANLSAFVNY